MDRFLLDAWTRVGVTARGIDGRQALCTAHVDEGERVGVLIRVDGQLRAGSSLRTVDAV
jgi:hypothetical protein